MKTTEELDNELQAWSPRGPSARLRDRIFGASEVEPAPAWPRLAFASAVAVALLLAICQAPSAAGMRGSVNSAMLAAAISNQDAAVYLVSSASQERNQPAASFRATNQSASWIPASFVQPAR
jgi:hypothetical protein